MALLFSSILGIGSISAAKPLNLLTTDQILTPPTEPPSPFPLSSNNSINTINSTLDLSAPYYVCWDESEGSHLIADQCMEALVNSDFARLPPNEMLTFEPRSSPSLAGQIGLPRRYLSSDGRCVIEPSLSVGVSKGHGTARIFNEAANRLIYRCVDHNAHTGGFIYKLGGDNSLEVKISSFKPNVQCYGSVDRQNMVPSCNNLADKMNTSPDLIPFASAPFLTPKVVSLPHMEVDPSGGGCTLAVSSKNKRGESVEFSSWYTVWQAVVAINAMCIRNGQRGKWLLIGHSIDDPGTINVDVGEAQTEQQTPIAVTA